MKTKKVFALLMAGLLALNATGISVLAETEENDSTEKNITAHLTV